MTNIITLGAATIDVFVNVTPEFRTDKKHIDACFPIGKKILIDTLNTSTGGGAVNTAISFSRLGLKTSSVCAVGNDEHGHLIQQALLKEKVKFLGVCKKERTGYSIILTGLQHDRTILAFKGANNSLLPQDISWNKLSTTWLYCTSMLGKSQKTLEQACLWAKKNQIPYAVNLSTYLATKGLRKLRKIVKNCDALIMNKEEAVALLGTPNLTTPQLLRKIQEHAKIVVITDGPRGAVAYNGIHQYSIRPHHIKVIETTGAGDAFGSGFVAGLHLYHSIERALQLGLVQSESVIQHIGATQGLLTRKHAEQQMRRPARIKITNIEPKF